MGVIHKAVCQSCTLRASRLVLPHLISVSINQCLSLKWICQNEISRMYLMGGLGRYIGRYIGRDSIDTRSILGRCLGRYSTDTRLTMDREIGRYIGRDVCTYIGMIRLCSDEGLTLETSAFKNSLRRLIYLYQLQVVNQHSMYIHVGRYSWQHTDTSPTLHRYFPSISVYEK